MKNTEAYLSSLTGNRADRELNRPTPAPWGEKRPTYWNIWTGIIAHSIEHAAQIAAVKSILRFGDRQGR